MGAWELVSIWGGTHTGQKVERLRGGYRRIEGIDNPLVGRRWEEGPCTRLDLRPWTHRNSSSV